MNVATKPWTVGNPPPPAENWTADEKRRCVAAANEALERGESEQDAVFACIAAAGKSEQKQDDHPHGDHECYCPECGHEETVAAGVKCNTVECLECGAALRARTTGELRSGDMDQKTILVQTTKVLSHEQIKDAVWERVAQPGPIEAIASSSNLSVDKVYDTYAIVSGGGKVYKLPFSVMGDDVVFGELIDGAMEFVPKSVEEKAASPSWKCGASRDFSVNEERAWDSAAAKERIFSWAGWDDSPKPAQARRCFLAYDSANADLKGSYKLPFADIVDGGPVAIRAGLGNAASRLPQTDIPESVQKSGQAVIDSYKGKYEKELVEGTEKGYAGADTEFKIFERNGQTMWVAVTSTAFRDREKEIVSRKALDYSIWFSDITSYRGFLNLYHMPHVRLGTCDFQMRVDEVLLEGGKWFDNNYANAVRDWVDNRAGQGGADEAGCSIEFVYNPEDRVKGIYDRVIIFNRAVLKRKHAANPYTWLESPEQIRRKNMSTVEDVKEILGDELAEEALAKAKQDSKEVRGTGAEFKGETVEPEADAAGEQPAEESKAEAPAEEVAPSEQPIEEEETVREVVFSEGGIKVLSEAIAKHLGVAEMKAELEALASAVKALAVSDQAIKANVRLVPKAILRDSEKGAGEPLPEDKIVGAEEKKSLDDEVAAARAKAFDGYVH